MGQRAAGTKAHWMGIYADRNRLMVAMTFNSDVGDSWEWADSPSYPEKFSALGIRLGVNFVVYSMTHRVAPLRSRLRFEHATVRERYGFGVVSGTGKVREPMAPDARS